MTANKRPEIKFRVEEYESVAPGKIVTAGILLKAVHKFVDTEGMSIHSRGRSSTCSSQGEF
jgi:hypothetical protein